MNIREYLLQYRGFGAEPGICHVVVAQDDGPATVLVGAPNENPGTSVTNALEEVSGEISTLILGGERDFRLYQYEPEGLPHRKPTFYRITWTPKAFRMPQWKPVTPESEQPLIPLANVLPEPAHYNVANLRLRADVEHIQPRDPRVAVKTQLTVGELFPADDVLAQWVFSLTALAEDLTAVTAIGRRVSADEPDIRIGLLYMRQMVTRLYEARRLIEVADQQPAVSHFITRLGGEENSWMAFLKQIYGHNHGKRSVVDELFEELRHATVHYSWVGSNELRDYLREIGWMPARLVVKSDPARLDYQWAQAASAWQLFNAKTGPDWHEEYKRRQELAGNIASAWMMLSPVALFSYVRDRGIDLERLADLPTANGGDID